MDELTALLLDIRNILIDQARTNHKMLNLLEENYRLDGTTISNKFTLPAGAPVLKIDFVEAKHANVPAGVSLDVPLVPVQQIIINNIGPNIVLISVLLIAVLISRFIAVGLVSYVFAGFRGDQIFFSSIAMLSVGEFALLIAKQSSGFALGVDIVTITSVLIFITAIIMSISVASSNRINTTYSSWSAAKTPSSLNTSLSQLAWYVRSFFDQVDTENTETRRFKSAFFSTGIAFLLFSYVFVGWEKIIGLAHTFELQQSLVYAIDAGFVILVSLFLVILYRKARRAQEALVSVLTGIDRMMNQRKSQRILKNLLMVAVFFISALFFPLIMYVFALPLWTNIISFILLGISFVYFNITSRILSTYKTSNHTSGRLYNSISLQQLYKSAPKPFASQKNTNIR